MSCSLTLLSRFLQPDMQKTASMATTGFMPLISSAGMQFSIPPMAATQQFFSQMAQNGFLNMTQAATSFANQQALRSFSTMTNAVYNPVQVSSGMTSAASSVEQPTVVATANPAAGTTQQLHQSYIQAVANHPHATTAVPLQNGPVAASKLATTGGNFAQGVSTSGLQTSGITSLTTATSIHPGATSTSGLSPVPLAPGCVTRDEGQTHNGGTANGPQSNGQLSSIPLGQMPSDLQPSATPSRAQRTATAFISSSGSPQEITTSSNPQSMATSGPSSTVASLGQTQFPDFVAGFDKVALSVGPVSIANAPVVDEKNALQCSPAFTSRSFDDFHRFLGKDLTPLDDGAAETALAESPRPTNTTTTNLPDRAFLDTSALFTAESYAMFAQESALAASQHAAYLAPGQDRMSTSANSPQGSFDFDGAMKLLSQHVPVLPRKDLVPAAGPLPNSDSKPQANKRSVAADTQTQSRTIDSRAAVVSGSELASSATESSLRGSTSESNGSDNTSSNSDEGHCESGEDSNSSDDGYSYEDGSKIQHKRKRTGHSFSSSQYDGSWDHHGMTEYKKRKLSGDVHGGQ